MGYRIHCRFQIADFRLPIADCQLPIADSGACQWFLLERLDRKTSNNLNSAIGNRQFVNPPSLGAQRFNWI
jgi:hypothetical protein